MSNLAKLGTWDATFLFGNAHISGSPSCSTSASSDFLVSTLCRSLVRIWMSLASRSIWLILWYGDGSMCLRPLNYLPSVYRKCVSAPRQLRFICWSLDVICLVWRVDFGWMSSCLSLFWTIDITASDDLVARRMAVSPLFAPIPLIIHFTFLLHVPEQDLPQSCALFLLTYAPSIIQI